MKRVVLLVAAAVTASALMVAGVAGAQGSGTKIGLRKTSLGTILVNSRGFTLYAFSKDGRNTDACVKISGCIQVWPAVTTTGKPVAGPGVKANLLGTIPYKGSLKQVTYAGHPLYSYVADEGPGSTDYVGESESGGTWPALNAAGHEIN